MNLRFSSLALSYSIIYINKDYIIILNIIIIKLLILKNKEFNY